MWMLVSKDNSDEEGEWSQSGQETLPHKEASTPYSPGTQGSLQPPSWPGRLSVLSLL
jgi:hypothetical protein